MAKKKQIHTVVVPVLFMGEIESTETILMTSVVAIGPILKSSDFSESPKAYLGSEYFFNVTVGHGTTISCSHNDKDMLEASRAEVLAAKIQNDKLWQKNILKATAKCGAPHHG